MIYKHSINLRRLTTKYESPHYSEFSKWLENLWLECGNYEIFSSEFGYFQVSCMSKKISLRLVEDRELMWTAEMKHVNEKR